MDITIIMTTYVQWSVSHELFIHSKIISKKYQEDIYSRNKGIIIIEKLIFNLLFKLIHIFILIRKLASEEKSSLDELKDLWMLNILFHVLLITEYERGWTIWLNIYGLPVSESALTFRMNQYIYHYMERTTDTESKTALLQWPVNVILFEKFIAKW